MTVWLRRWGGRLSGFAAGAVAVGALWWAVPTATQPSVGPPDEADAPVSYVVVEGVVQRDLALQVDARWEVTPWAVVGRSGTVTSVAVEPGQLVDVGEQLMTVDLVPVVVGSGAVPAFRSLERGTSGDDVAQLQAMLADLGFFAGDVDGRFEATTLAAVRAWQATLGPGAPVSGVVERGAVVFVPDLPRRVALADWVRVGAAVPPDEPMLHVLAPEPALGTLLGGSQFDLVAPGMGVRIDAQGWAGEVTEVVPAPDVDGFRVRYGDGRGGPLCGPTCARVPVDGAVYSVTVEVVPEAAGPAVPTSALVADPAGRALVVMAADGALRPVQVVASDGGVAIVSGVGVGEVILVHGATP